MTRFMTLIYPEGDVTTIGEKYNFNILIEPFVFPQPQSLTEVFPCFRTN